LKSLIHRGGLALVLIIFCSQTALLAHVVYHTDKEGVNCQLCICQAQQANGLPALDYYLPVAPGRLTDNTILHPYFPATVQLHPYYQRAPPLVA